MNARPTSTRPRSNPRKPRRRLTLLLALLLAALFASQALAQDEGGGAPAGGGASAAGGSEVGGSEAGGSEEGDLTDFQATAKISKVRGLGVQHVPQVHKVKKGDTLWSITQRYFRNPYLWPALWSYNPHITNPNWIYPEDLVFLKPANGAGLGGGGGDGDGNQDLRDLFGMAQESGIMVLPVGYYTEEGLEGAGRVIFSPEEKSLLTQGDEAYIDWEKKEDRDKAIVGQRYAVLHEMDPVINADTDEAIARKLRLVGALKMVYSDGQTLPTGLLSDVLQEVERGDLVLPIEDSLFRLSETKAGIDTEGRIIDTFDIVTQLGEQQFVLINRGKKDSVERGNRFLVFEQREGLLELPPGEETKTNWAARQEEKRRQEDEGTRDRESKIDAPGDVDWPLGDPPLAPQYPELEEDDNDFRYERDYTASDLPLRQIGEILVVKTTDKFCTALVVDSRREFNLGTRVTLFAR